MRNLGAQYKLRMRNSQYHWLTCIILVKEKKKNLT